MDKEKIVVGMSGGVDSSVTAYLLKEEGYEVIGVTACFWCLDSSEIDDARRVCEKLEIEHHVVDFTEEFRRRVVDDFVNEYKNTRTPNPCIRCNRYMKWEALLSFAQKCGADKIATGHYATIVKLDSGRYTVCDKSGNAKDQSYVLYQLTQEQLKKTVMPLGQFSKEEIRAIAAKIDLCVADKKDSQDICFIPDGDYAKFLHEYDANLKDIKGNFVDKAGQIIGQHKGLIHYTIGQRKGLGLAMGEPVYVVELNKERNEVVIGSNEDVFGTRLLLKDCNAMGRAELFEEFTCMAKIRYAHRGAICKVKPVNDDCLEVCFDEPQRAITQGQSVVFYEENDNGRYILGGGIIEKAL